MQILNKNEKINPLLTLSTSNIWDFILEKRNYIDSDKILPKNNLIAHIELKDFRCVENNKLFSKYENTWGDAVYENATFNNIGFTGIDNGLIQYNLVDMNNEKFLKLLNDSIISFNDGRLTLSPIKSNTGTYSTDFEFIHNEESFVALKGGGFQGFFKSSDNKYQVLPSHIGDCWTIQMRIRPMDYNTKKNTINNLHPQNKNIFFYIGTRSENKFLNDYNYEFLKYDIRNNVNYDNCDEIKNNYFKDDYILIEKKIDGTDISINEMGENYFEIETNNKFLFFNDTKKGFNSDNWKNDDKIILTGISRPNINMYLCLNNTKTGYTTDTIDSYIKNYEKKEINEKLLKDISNNCFALKINENGSIGYRYLVKDCETGIKLIEEYSFANIIKKNEWNNVTVKFKIIKGGVEKHSERKMIIYIYVNNYLKFISKKLPDFNFKPLNEINAKQEGVPFNISLGCGSMGLCNSISWDYNKPFKYILPIEKYFAGTFIGDISDFKFYMT